MHYDLDQRFRALDLNVPVRNDDGFGHLRRLMALCPRIDWNETDILTDEPVPPSLAPDKDSYAVILTHPDLSYWAVTQGWKKALEEEQKNS